MLSPKAHANGASLNIHRDPPTVEKNTQESLIFDYLRIASFSFKLYIKTEKDREKVSEEMLKRNSYLFIFRVLRSK